ncbi:MAG TPA: HEAT repeat domain-containing protein [Candidatus Acidoferrales bacterium]|nr:HEAT repeat domain-containing protein [Candidatus Acidoferrales bacterium]
MDCKTAEEKLALHLYDELTPAERAELDAHLAACTGCADAAAELNRLRTVLDQRPRPEPSPDLLVRCRFQLEEALDRETSGWRALVHGGFGLWPQGSALRVTAALAVLVVGFSLGWTLRQQTSLPGVAGPAPPAWGSADLSNARISGISRVAPNPQTGAVRITLDAERQFTLEGSLEDPHIQEVLLYAVKSYDNPGIRRDTLEVLRSRGSDPVVRDTLLYALHNDPNDGVRLEVLQALHELAWTPQIRQAVLASLERDTNPGVRVAAINILAQHADEEVLPRLEQLAVEDRNPYVRLKCANAVREKARQEF